MSAAHATELRRDRRPAVLWLSNETPDVGGQGGQRRQYFQIRELAARGVRVMCVTLAGDQDDTSVRRHAEVERISPRAAAKIPDVTAARRLHRLLRSPEWDAVVVAHLESWPLVRVHPRAPVLVDIHNVMSPWLRQQGETREAAAFERRERRILHRADVVTVCSVAERDRLAPGGGAARAVLPHGIDPDEWSDAPPAGSPRVVGMFGSWRWAPNQEGLRWFLDSVWPRVLDAVPDAECVIAGSGAPADAASLQGVRLAGRVPDLAAFAGGCRAIAVPVHSGVGAPVKLGESLATGRPVVATTDGASAHPDSPAIVTDDPAAMAASLVDLLLDPESAQLLGKSCREYALGEITWRHTTRQLLDWITRTDHAWV